jgi:hypothetical protein
MGHQPIPPMLRSAEGFLAMYESKLRRELRGRDSIWPWKHRRAYHACLTLIKAREALCDLTPDPWEIRAPPNPPRPAEPTYAP